MRYLDYEFQYAKGIVRQDNTKSNGFILYDRKLLSDLSRCAWDSLGALLLPNVRDPDASPGAVIAIQTFGDFLNFNPHCHVLCTDGVFYASGWFKVAPALGTAALEKVFQHMVLKMLLRKRKIAEELVKLILSWRHSGFNVHWGPRNHPKGRKIVLPRFTVRYGPIIGCRHGQRKPPCPA